MMIIERYVRSCPARWRRQATRGADHIAQPGAPAEVTIPSTAPSDPYDRRAYRSGAFTASECFNVGIDLGSPVSLDYFDRRPFPFDGTIHAMHVDLLTGETV